MHHGFLLILANVTTPVFLSWNFGIFAFWILGLLIGWIVWRGIKKEVERVEEENRRFNRAYNLRQKNFLKQQDKITLLSKTR